MGPHTPAFTPHVHHWALAHDPVSGSFLGPSRAWPLQTRSTLQESSSGDALIKLSSHHNLTLANLAQILALPISLLLTHHLWGQKVHLLLIYCTSHSLKRCHDEEITSVIYFTCQWSWCYAWSVYAFVWWWTILQNRTLVFEIGICFSASCQRNLQNEFNNIIFQALYSTSYIVLHSALGMPSRCYSVLLQWNTQYRLIFAAILSCSSGLSVRPIFAKTARLLVTGQRKAPRVPTAVGCVIRPGPVQVPLPSLSLWPYKRGCIVTKCVNLNKWKYGHHLWSKILN